MRDGEVSAPEAARNVGIERTASPDEGGIASREARVLTRRRSQRATVSAEVVLLPDQTEGVSARDFERGSSRAGSSLQAVDLRTRCRGASAER